VSTTIQAEITYYAPDERPSPEDRPDFNALPLRNFEMTVEDLRASGPTSLDEEGFRFVESPSSVQDFRDLSELDRVYTQEMREFIREITGATETRIAGRPGLRSSAPVEQRGPAMMTGSHVHADVSVKGGEWYLDHYLPEEAERWREHRFAIFNVWRSFSRAPQDWPLGVCDIRSVDLADKQLCDIVLNARGQGELRWETQTYVHNPDHHWYYASDMRPNEALVFRTYDTGRSEATPHAAFVNPTVPADVPPRESVEIRVFALFED
jgi:hypothetical protein